MSKDLKISNAELTRRRNEERTDVAFEVTAFERTELECPKCGETQPILYATSGMDVSYSECWSWECDAYHKIRAVPPKRPESDEEQEQPNTTLDSFVGDAHAD